MLVRGLDESSSHDVVVDERGEVGPETPEMQQIGSITIINAFLKNS